MNLISAARRALGRLAFSAEDVHHGLQMATAVIAAYLVSLAVGLPESLWAVMSTLIVMRPNAASTLDAGWARVAGTVTGAFCGVLGVALQQFGTNPLVTMLGIVALLAFASAAAPTWRSAPVAALIVLAAGGLAGHSALQAAGLRVVQIVIGVAVAMAVAVVSSRYRAGTRLQGGCASLLRRIALPLQTPGAGERPSEIETQAAAAAVRDVLGRLAALAGSADREPGWFRRARGPVDTRRYRRIAGLTGRIVQDTGVLSRVLQAICPQADDRLRIEVNCIAGAAVASIAGALVGDGPPELGALRELARVHADRADDAAVSSPSSVWLAAPLHLLLDDLQRLGACVADRPMQG